MSRILPRTPPLTTAAVATAVSCLLTLTACGGGYADDAPTDAGLQEYCTEFASTTLALLADPTATGLDAQVAAITMHDLGTPPALDEVRAGFELWINAARKAPETELFSTVGASLSEDDSNKIFAWITESSQVCRPLLGLIGKPKKPTS